MQKERPRGNLFVRIRTVTVTSGDVSSAPSGHHQTRPAPAEATETAPDVEARLEALQRDIPTFVAQAHARAGWHAVAGAVSCGVAVAAGLVVRAVEGHWLFTGLDLAVLMPPVGYFFQMARKAEENARHFQALRGTIQHALAGAGARQTGSNADDKPPMLLPPASFHATHASEEQRRLRTEILDLLNRSGAALVPVSTTDTLPSPERLEFLGQVDPRRFLVRADGRDCLLPRILYRMLLGMAARRILFGNALPRGNDPGSFFCIGDRRDRVHDLEVAFREIGLRILDEDGKGTKMRRVQCPPEGISMDPAVHLSDPAIVEDEEVRALLEALAARSPTNGHPT